jgi:hypothetical protein
VKLPGQAEALVSVYIERFEEDNMIDADFIIEPTTHFRNLSTAYARKLVNINRGPTCKVVSLIRFITTYAKTRFRNRSSRTYSKSSQ